MRTTIFIAMLLAGSSLARAADSVWAGEWVTDLGLLSLDVRGEKVGGTYGGDGSIEGKVDGRTLTFSWQRGRGSGNGSFRLEEGGASFKGSWSSRGGGGNWRGWKKDPAATKADAADFSGAWLTSFGTLFVTQKGARATPLAMVHGALDAQWGPSTGDYNFDRFAAHGFPMLTYMKPNASHAYDFLPIGDVVAWLDVMSTTDTRKLVSFARDRAKAEAVAA